jgi:hypothetical protein
MADSFTEVIDLRRVLHLRRSDFLLDQGKRPAIRHTSKRTTPKTQPATKHCSRTSPTTRMPLQGTKHPTMTDTIHIALCKHHTENPKLTQKEFVIWLQQMQEFIRSLQQMKNKINKIRVNQMV